MNKREVRRSVGVGEGEGVRLIVFFFCVCVFFGVFFLRFFFLMFFFFLRGLVWVGVFLFGVSSLNGRWRGSELRIFQHHAERSYEETPKKNTGLH